MLKHRLICECCHYIAAHLQDEFMLDVWFDPRWTCQQIAGALNLHPSTVSRRARNLGLPRKPPPRKWDVSWLKRNYGRVPAEAIAERLGVTLPAVHMAAHRYGCSGAGDIA